MAAPIKNQNQNLPDKENQMPFGKMNYIVCLAGLILVLFGFFLMAGEKFIDAKEFSKALYLSPPIIIIGFAIMAYGIMMNPAKNQGSENKENKNLTGK